MGPPIYIFFMYTWHDDIALYVRDNRTFSTGSESFKICTLAMMYISTAFRRTRAHLNKNIKICTRDMKGVLDSTVTILEDFA